MKFYGNKHKKVANKIGIVVFVLFSLILGRLIFVNTDELFAVDTKSQRWSYAYFVTIHSRMIKGIPVIKPINSPTFTSNPSIGYDREHYKLELMTYHSQSSTETLVLSLCNYIERSGYERLKEGGHDCDYAFTKGGARCEFDVEQVRLGESRVFVADMYPR